MYIGESFILRDKNYRKEEYRITTNVTRSSNIARSRYDTHYKGPIANIRPLIYNNKGLYVRIKESHVTTIHITI